MIRESKPRDKEDTVELQKHSKRIIEDNIENSKREGIPSVTDTLAE